MRKFNVLLFVSLFSVFTIVGSASAESDYHIGKEDLLDIEVWGSPELSKEVAVDRDGAITYGFLGRFEVTNLTPDELSSLLAQKLSQGYVKDPKVSVTVKEYNSKRILVFGEVEKPGMYKIRQEMPVLEMLFLVGGVKSDAKRMTVIRPLGDNSEKLPTGMIGADVLAQDSRSSEDSSETVHEVDLIALLSKGDLSQNILIKPGDTVYVASGTGQKFYVLGMVNTPGPIEWTGEITVLEAIKLAGGPTEQAALNRILLRQNQGSKQNETKVNVMAIMKGKQKDDSVVQPGNVVIVPRSWV